MSMHPKDSLHVVVFAEDDRYVAQCLQIDIFGEGGSPDDALKAFGHAMIRHVLAARTLGVAPFENTPPADETYHRMWDQGCAAGRETQPFRIPNFTIRRRTDALAEPRTSEIADISEIDEVNALICAV